MPEGIQKKKITLILDENRESPLTAMDEINRLSLLTDSQSGDSANWSVLYDIDAWIDDHMMLTIGVLVVGMTAAIVYTEGVKKKKLKEYNDKIEKEIEEEDKEREDLWGDRNVTGQYVPGLSSNYYGSSEFATTSFDECKLSNASAKIAIEEAIVKARAACTSEPRVDQRECSVNRPGISLRFVAGVRCVATASVNVTVLRVD